MAISDPKPLSIDEFLRLTEEERRITADIDAYENALAGRFGPLAAIILGAESYDYDTEAIGTPPASTSDTVITPIAGESDFELHFHGEGLGFDSVGAPVGSFDFVELVLPGPKVVYSLRTPDLVSLPRFFEAADEGSGIVNFYSYTSAFDLLLRPEQGFDHFYEGQDYGEDIEGFGANDRINAAGGDDRIMLGNGQDTLDGGHGQDAAEGIVLPGAVNIDLGAGTATHSGGSSSLSNIENATGSLFNDRLLGDANDNVLNGLLGSDTLNGGDGNDTLVGGPGEGDLRDVVFAGSGNDSVDAGAGNDQVFGQGGNDTIAGGAGVDDLQGQDGDDVITGSNFSDLVFGGAGDDFVNGGFGSDRINGGTGADKFFHVGVRGHGSDWLQDYTSAEGDVLLWGGGAATADDFQVNFAHTENAEGERAGEDDVTEGFVIYRPTGQIIWALVDGGGQDAINIQIGGDTFDLLG